LQLVGIKNTIISNCSLIHINVMFISASITCNLHEWITILQSDTEGASSLVRSSDLRLGGFRLEYWPGRLLFPLKYTAVFLTFLGNFCTVF
jgi:hypothetical protein